MNIASAIEYLRLWLKKIYHEKSAEVIVPQGLKTGWEGLNFRRCE